MPSLARVLAFAMLAGVIAGLGTAAFHATVSEPLVEQAIMLEEMRGAAEALPPPGPAGAPTTAVQAAVDHPHAAPVAREAQRLGLWIGWIGLGVSWGDLLGSAYFLSARHLGGFASRGPRALIGAAAWWTLALMPALKYPASPPGVGDPETIGLRLRYFAGLELMTALFVALAVVVAIQLQGSLGRRFGVPGSWALGAVILLVASVTMYLGLPANPDEVDAPSALLAAFRRDSGIGLTLFWLLFTAAFVTLPLTRRLRFAPAVADSAGLAQRAA